VRIKIDAIAFDAGTQVRAAIDQQVVTDYAEAMTAGATFPPIVLFHDGTQHYLADGFHRFLAAQRNKFKDIDSDVRPGTKDDALWFALGANKAHGKRLSNQDKRHAIKLAVERWPEKSGALIAEQIGCSRSYVVQIKSGMTTTADRIVSANGHVRMATQAAAQTARAEARELLKAGVSVDDVRKRLRIGRDALLEIRHDLGLGVNKTRGAVQQRREQMRRMASEGHTSRQIAASLGLTDVGCRAVLKKEGIKVHADEAVRGSRHHDANRIVDQIVMDAENLTGGISLIDFSSLDRARLADWLVSLRSSRKALDSFVNRLLKEKDKHGEAA